MPTLNAVIMAAGSSKRMGSNKLLLPLGNCCVIEQFLKKFPFHFFQRTTLIYSHPDVAAYAAVHPVTLCENTHLEKGKSHTIHLGQSASMDADGTMYFVADQPLLTQDTVETLVTQFLKNTDQLILPTAKGQPRNPVIFPSTCYDELLNLQGDVGGKVVIEQYRYLITTVQFKDDTEFIDIDTEASYEKVKSIWT